MVILIKTLYPCFQHWSANGSVYLVSDTHFYDSDRAFMGYDISEEEQIKILREKIHKNDTLIHLGDVGAPELMNDIKAHKVLIMGNHDETATQFIPFFDEIYTGPLWIAEKLVISHEPIEIAVMGTNELIAFNIHGHNHSRWNEDNKYSLNICQNVYGYEPLNLKEFINSGALKRIQSIHRVTIDNASTRRH